MIDLAGGPGAHIGTTEEIFRFGMFNETYLGRGSVRGIICDHWNSAMNLPSISMQLDWYFSAEFWDTPQAQSKRIPVRLHLRGESQRR